MRKPILAVLAVGLLTGCGSTRPPSATSSTPVARAHACGPGARAFYLDGPGRIRLEVNSVGGGADAVVFLHEAGRAGMCGFWEYARWLTAHAPVQAVLVNRCAYGQTVCPSVPTGDAGIRAMTAPAVAWARAHGASRITLVGASSGGSDALEAGGVISGVSAVVDLSGDVTDTGADDVTDARRLRIPALFAVAPQDRYSPLDRVRTVFTAVAVRPKRLLVVRDMPGMHGWSLLFDGSGRATPLARTVAAWATGHMS
jgi:hypothetical protein